MARPRKDSEETIRKLEEGAALDCDVDEMCALANISRDTYYRWIKENPKLSDRLDKLRQEPFLKARRTIVEGLSSYNNAMDYMKRKKKKEFGDNIDVTSDGDKITPIYGGKSNNIQGHDSNKEDISTDQEN